jgi:hypothetical protein
MKSSKTYYLFMDESGDHGLANLDASFPVFLLCGLLVSEKDYAALKDAINQLKEQFWNHKKVILHSRDIRKCEKEFQILFDIELKGKFYSMLNSIIQKQNYTVFASAIQKEKYILTYGRLSNDVYELALSFIIERAVFCLDAMGYHQKELVIEIERRGKKEDKKLDEHFQRLLARGTGFVSPIRLRALNLKIKFTDKRENINGLQLADLLAYPAARYVLDKERANPAFDLFRDKFYTKDGKMYGLKIFP